MYLILELLLFLAVIFVMDVENEEKVNDDIDDVRPGTVA
jgi:predicted RNA-binding protein with TRAM domain